MNRWQRVVWILTLGPLFALPWLVFSAIAAATVIALPWARAASQVAIWVAWPTAEVPSSSWEQGSNLQAPPEPTSTSTAGYIVWVAVAGLWLSVLHHIVAALLGLTIVGIVALFPHLELGRVALVLNPGTFRMAPRGERRLGMPWAQPVNAHAAAEQARVQFP